MRDAGRAGSATGDVLLVVGNGALMTIELGDTELVIGRGKDCDVVLDHPLLSRRHAAFRPGPPATIRDLESTNGTRVAGEVHRGGDPIALGSGGFHIGPFAFVIVPRERTPERVSSGDALLQVIDPTPQGVTPLIKDVARSGANVLILGETGVGKEVLAATLHQLSGRTGMLTQINCAALAESLLESELFGHEKGAFTGAAAQRIGLIEAADGRTVFLH